MEVTLFNCSPIRDLFTLEYQQWPEHWRDVANIPTSQVAAHLRREEFDVLVNLSGFFPFNGLHVLAERVAPVQINYPNYPGTTGSPCVDYALTDLWTSPPGTEGEYSERLHYVPTGYLGFDVSSSNVDVGPLPCVTNRRPTFGVFQRLSKFTSAVWDALAGVLAAVPDAHLHLVAGDEELARPDSQTTRAVMRELESRGVDVRRVSCLPPRPRRDQLLALTGVDVALDTFPYNGQTTTCEALWMGVPVVTLFGQSHVGRVSGGLVARAGHADWIAHSTTQDPARLRQPSSPTSTGLRGSGANFAPTSWSAASPTAAGWRASSRPPTPRWPDQHTSSLTRDKTMTPPEMSHLVCSTEPSVDWRVDNEDPIAFPGPHDRLLECLQGNILKGHGRDYTVNIVLRFSDSATAGEIRQELKRLAKKFVKSAAHQLIEGAQRRAYGLPGGLFANLFLSRTAYMKLGYESKIPAWFEDGDSRRPANFLSGMKDGAKALSDVLELPDEPLEVAYTRGHIDALLLLADDDRDYLLRRARQAVTRIHERHVAKVVAIEPGRILRNEDRQGIEHFGYVDGRSQPLFLASDFSNLIDGKVVPGETKERLPLNETGDLRIWNPFAKLSLALLKDPGVDDPDAYGSYYVFRKLEQNVRDFAQKQRELACALGLDEDDPRVGAMVVGRFTDGTPLVLSDTSDPSLRLANDFRYDDLTLDGRQRDRLGLKCPFHAHIRKVSPRQDEAVNGGDLFARRIVRRGITYGERPDLGQARPVKEQRRTEHPLLPATGVGLLFACFQRSIMEQFTFIQSRWANNKEFPLGGGRPYDMAGLDAVLGPEHTVTRQNWRTAYGGSVPCNPPCLKDLCVPDSHPTSFPFNGFVKFRGGEFFFAPSLPFLLGK